MFQTYVIGPRGTKITLEFLIDFRRMLTHKDILSKLNFTNVVKEFSENEINDLVELLLLNDEQYVELLKEQKVQCIN